MNGLTEILEHIRADAEREAQALLADAQSRADGIRAEWKNRAAACEAENDKKRDAEVSALLSRAESSVANIRRDALENARSALVEKVYADVAGALRDLPREEYLALLYRLLSDAVSEELRVERDSRALYGEEADDADSFEVMLNARDFAACGRELLAVFKEKAPAELARAFSAEEINTACERLTLANRTVRIDGGLILRICHKADADRRDGNIEINCSLAALVADLRQKTEEKVLTCLFPPA